MSGGGEVEDNLTEVEARARGTRVSNTSYKLKLTFERGASDYKGHLVAKFDHKQGTEDLFLDFITKKVEKLTVNGQDVPVNDEVVKNHRVYLPKNALKDSNEIHISYVNAYDKTGNGLHHFVDPEDKEEYLYTNFEPFYAHRLLPCFDQPDVKARFELSVTVPSEWTAVANDKEASRSVSSDKKTTEYHFQATPPLSTYLYALVVGPYAVYSDKYNNVPMSMYVRKSLQKYLEPDLKELFTITKQGLQFYEEFYACPYPFSKYDQIFCPEYNIGAMENPGCITFTERYVFRDPPTDEQRLRRGDTFLHEMAHMWFGDLVSPVWWDGLWLNESFASYMAALAIAESTRFGSKSWLEFHTAYKRWAYREDQLSTTHAIQGQVVDTNSTFQNFDGITYGKGASVLKQLVAVVDMKGFKAGMQYYFKKHPWGNTTIGDFLHAIEVGAKTDLKEWSKLWLETPGLNTLTPVWTVQNGKISNFHIDQTAQAPHTALRPHRLECALFDSKADGAVTYRSSVFIDVKGARTEVPQLAGQDAPAAVFINHNDHAYAKVNLDHTSLTFMRERLHKFEDPLLRQLIWSSVFNMVRDAQCPAQDFLELVYSKVAFEADPKLLQFIIRAAEGTLSSFLPPEQLVDKAAEFFELCLKQLHASKTQDEKIMWARSLIGAARSKANVQKLLDMVDKGAGVAEFELDQDMRWSIVEKASAHGFEDANKRAEAESTRDPSDRGKRAMECFKTCAPDPKVKEAAWQRFITDTESSMKMINAAMGGFHWWHQKDLLAPYEDRFFEQIQQIFKTREFAAAENFYNILYPGHHIEGDVKNKSQKLLDSLDHSKDTILVRCLKESIDDINRSLACYEVARKHQRTSSH